jgi:hypothetical protein
MAIKSHYYLDKVLAQHPTSLYALSNGFHTTSNIKLNYFSSTDSGKIITDYAGNGDFGYVKSDVSIRKVAPIVNGSEYSLYFYDKVNTITLPSQGFMNPKEKYGEYTLEFWTRIDKPQNGRRKIVGSLANDNNGLYVNQTSLVLKIGRKSASCYIKDFNRPMLIQITYSPNTANLMVNGEIVATLLLELSDIEQISASSYIVFGQGTYDCIAIYPYRVEKDLASLRFNYGQAVTFKDETVSPYDGQSIVIDSSKSNYAANYIHPITAPWSTAKNDNVDLQNNPAYMMTYRYELPTFNSTSTETGPSLTSTVFNLKPSSGNLSTATSNLEIPSLNMLKDSTKGFYIHGYYSTLPSSEQVLFKLTNSLGDYFKITVNSSTIYFKLKYGATPWQTVLTSSGNNLALYNTVYNFIVGIDIQEFSDYCSEIGIPNVANFFSNPESLAVFVCGDDDITATQTSTANIYSVKFLTQDNLDKRSLLKLSNGIFYYPSAINTTPTGAEALQNNILGSYDLRVYVDTLNFSTETNKLSVATNGYMKTNIPLTHFCKQTDSNTYSFDFLQFNYSYESPILINSSDTTKLETTNKLTTSSRSYITFEPLNEEAKEDSYFTTNVLPYLNRTVFPSTGWQTTKYEITDNFIIYPPSGIDLKEYAAVIHLDFDVLDTENNRIEIQKMSLSSQALNASTLSKNPIGTKFGADLIPYTYTLDGSTRVYNYRGYNPFLIGKNDNPHLYLSRDSGIRLVGITGAYRGIKLPIPEDDSVNFLQLSIFYEAGYFELTSSGGEAPPYIASFPNETETIFEINGLQFQLTRTGNGDTATLSYSQIGGGSTTANISFYLNGELVESPVISTNNWYTLGILFESLPSSSGYLSEFALVGRISIDNLSYYNTTVSPQNLYSMFTGTNKVFSEENLDRSIALNYEKYKYHYQDDTIKDRLTYIIS